MSVQNPHRTPRPRATRRAAFYDLDGTLIDLNLLHAVGYILGNLGEWHARLTRLAALAARIPLLYAAERYDRRLLNVELFALFKGVSRDRLTVLGEEYCERILTRHLFQSGLDLLEGNRSAGLEPVLVTGSPDFLVEPLARRLRIEHSAVNQPAYSRGIATGRLCEPIMAGEEKARWCEQWARRGGLQLADCWGYADSYYDLPFLVALGHPVAVNPDRRLAATARVRQWPIVHFGHPMAVNPLTAWREA
jgi:HAD superfamily hydrolase (TIGR01490 family)